MKKLICALLAVLMAVTLLGCAKKEKAEGDLAYILDKKTLVVGITENPPMNYYDDAGKLVGFDTEFTEELCKRLGVTPEFTIIEWSSKETELKARSIDVIWNGLTVTDERRENMAFTTSYLHNEQVVVVRAADATLYTSVESLVDKAVVAEDGSAGMDAIAEFMPDAKFTAVSTQATALMEVKAGTAEAAVLDLTMARTLTAEGTDYSDLVIVTSIEMWPEEYAIGLRLDSTAVAKFNSIITEMVKDGTLKAIAEKYDLANEMIAE